MNRTIYFSFIEEKINVLSTRIKSRGKLNILDLHIHSEDFYRYLLNMLFEWNLENMNSVMQNVEGIDLIDVTNKLIIQVSATCTKQKIEHSLNKEILSTYPGYKFKIIFISNDADSLRKKTYKNPYNIEFLPDEDILDIPIVLRTINSLEINKLIRIYDFIKKELASEVNVVKLDSNLAIIINILSKENFVDIDGDIRTNSFEIDKKIIFNDLKLAKLVIDDYIIHYSKLDKKYKEFDKMGANKSYTVLQTIRQQYTKICMDGIGKSSDQIFFEVKEKVRDLIMNSKNYIEIPIEELELCVDILVVDAFIRCKIFKNPEGYNYVVT